VLRVPPGEEQTWLLRLRASPDVLYAELNGIMRIH
jgi:hypothetical protein